MAAVRGTPSGVPVSVVPGFPTCVQLPPIRLETNVAALRTIGSKIMNKTNPHDPSELKTIGLTPFIYYSNQALLHVSRGVPLPML
jgi:hypothetical protein